LPKRRVMPRISSIGVAVIALLLRTVDSRQLSNAR